MQVQQKMSRLMGKPTICICENKDADQLRGNREADQRLCFRYWDSTIPLLLKSEISSFYLFSVLVQAGLCRTCSETTLLVFPRDGSNIRDSKSFFLKDEAGHKNEFPTTQRTSEPPRGKTNNVVSEQVRHKPACTVTEAG